MLVFYIVLAVLGIGLIIFFHELGHFLAAKKVGIRVERFALGFDPSIAGRRLRFGSWTRGETEYVLGMIPFGGYVKMAGEILPELDREPKEDELLAKSAGARALVFAAGAIMNILTAFVLFMIAFTIGVPFDEARIGAVEAGWPAWEAGLRAGDQIIAIDGERAVDFSELRLAAAFSGEGNSFRVEIRREAAVAASDAGSPPETIELEVTPRWSEVDGIYRIGASPSFDPVLQEDPPPDSPAYLAGLRSGDEIVAAEINGELLSGLPPDPLLSAVANAVTYVGHRPLRLQVRRGADELWVTLQPRKSDDQETISRVQILSPFPGEPYSGTTVKAIAPGSRAMEVFATGDRVLSIAGQPAGSLHPLALMGRFTEESLEIEVETMSGQRRAFSVPRKDLLLWSLLGDVQWLDVGARIGRLSEDSPLRVAGLEEEDVIAAVGEQRVYSPKEARSELVKSDSAARSMRVLRSGSWITISWTPPDAQADLGVEWSSFAPIACVVPGGAADQAGITSGSRIVEVNGERVVDYEKQFYEEVTESAPGSELEMAWIDPAGVRRHARLTIGAEVHADPGLTIGKRTKTVKVSILESFGVGFQRTVFFGKQVFLTLRSLLRREVSPKNLAGPVGITDILTRAAQLGLVQLVYFMALISVNLGILNLLPFPILDGGHLLFLAIEKIKGSPVNVRVQEWATSIAFFLIISFAIFVTFHDVRRLFFWR